MEPHSSVWYTPSTILHNFRICPNLLQHSYKYKPRLRLEFKKGHINSKNLHNIFNPSITG